MDAEVLKPLQNLATTAGLVRLAMRRARPTQRLRLLRYLQGIAKKPDRNCNGQVFLIQRSSADFNQVVETMLARLTDLGPDSLVQRLAHICAVRDYFTTFEHEDREIYDPSESDMLAARAWNEGRLQLAMEAGIQPLFVDDPGESLEQSGYVKRAKALGYRVNFENLH